MKKKVVFLITGLYYGGMERVVFIAYNLLKEHYDISVVTLYANEADYTPDFEYIDLNCPPKSGKIPKALNIAKRTNAVRKMKKEINPDIVMSFGTSANFANVASKGKEKVVVGIRSYDWLTNYFATYSIDKWTYNKADMVVSVSKVIAEEAERVFKLEKSKSKVLYNPYDVNYIREKAKEEITEIGVLNNNKTLISVGRLVNQKGFNHLIKAFSLVLNDFPDVQLLIVGHGDKETQLRRLIKDLGLESNVILMGGQENPYKFMKHSDLYVLSSLTEGFPNAMVEAMSVGLPILAVDCKSGPREILSLSDHSTEAQGLEKCEYGVIVPEVSKSFDYDASNLEDCDYDLANGMKAFLSNSDLLEQYSNKSYERAQKFTYEEFKNNLIRIFDSL
ncbi:glycosyltransferase [Bacillus cereus]|nr:glycosyltransferase [Bacillus cereus]MCU5713800.1 glycosyltransferase [Bacillus cereus]BCB40341.1 glycosyltransferase [Bacillus cereus]BCC03175.1 glycosyltransferase [Bacillus cereus]BCC26691.1 glycosyltransferase [Bacillus cereus]BCC38255.1 glycosyltransferase [Bacillus cereus]